MTLWRFIGTGALTIGTLAGAASAVQPTKGDMDLCNQKAAQVGKATPVKPGAGTTTGRQADGTKPGTPVSPGAAGQPTPGAGSPQSGSNPTGGRVTDSSQPGISASQLGMAAIGETDPAYRRAYLACINERAK